MNKIIIITLYLFLFFVIFSMLINFGVLVIKALNSKSNSIKKATKNEPEEVDDFELWLDKQRNQRNGLYCPYNSNSGGYVSSGIYSNDFGYSSSSSGSDSSSSDCGGGGDSGGCC